MVAKAEAALDLLRFLNIPYLVTPEGEYVDRDWCIDVLEWHGVWDGQF